MCNKRTKKEKIFYSRWSGMVSRCKKDGGHKNYAGRGISVCKRWKNYENFKEDMYEEFLTHLKKHGKRNTTIDRIDNNGNYCPENCRWADFKTQANNKSNNVKVFIMGRFLTIAQISRITNISRQAIHAKYISCGEKTNSSEFLHYLMERINCGKLIQNTIVNRI